jgi:hypothetical protein
MAMPPQLAPPQLCDTRTQQELSAFFLPSRSQWNCTFTRPYLSGKMVSPGGPTTMAVCVPWMIGSGVSRCGR